MPKTKFGITYYSTAEAADRIGRSKRTTLEHIYQKRIKDVRKNDLGEREWLEKDIQRFTKYFQNLSMKLRSNGRRKGKGEE